MIRRKNRYTADLSIAFDKSQYVESELLEQVTLWMLRVIVKAGGFKEFLDKNNYFNDDSVAYFLDLGDYVEKEGETFERREVYTLLHQKLQRLEKEGNPTLLPSLQRNVDKISKLVGLDETQKKILAFAAVMKNYKILETTVEFLGRELTTKQAKGILSVILDIPVNKVEEALSARSALIESSLIDLQTDRWLTSDLTQKLEFPSDHFVEFLLYSDEDITQALKASVKQVDGGVLSLKDYDYINKDVRLLRDYLKQGLKQKQKGINILLYGIPGTGKTELAKSLAKSLKCDLFEVSYIDESEEEASRNERLKAYKSAQALLKKRRVLLMYDEAEDIFDTYDGFFSQKKQQGKAWINHMLESNPIPTVWITNDIESVDPAIVRRFDMAMEMQVPKKKKRIEILQHYSQGLLEEKTLKKLAKNPYISPAVMQRAIKVATRSKPKAFSKTVYRLIDKTLKAQRYPSLESMRKQTKKKPTVSLPDTYDVSLVNVDTDLEKLSEGISKTHNARLCFYGVPGTGKSAYGRYIAKRLGREAIVKKGSDLLSMWVGGTEKNIADAFAEAKKKKAVLIFDEVDSFLQDRRNASASWQVTQVNEMLVQMETFEGVFIATTNLMEGLDQASLRRFDMKLEFGYMKPQQAWRLFVKECEALGIEMTHKAELKKKITRLSTLAPGDFTAIRRQHHFNPIETAEVFLERLGEEVAVKEESQENKMGFL